MVGVALTAFLAGCLSAPAPSNSTTPWAPPSRAQNPDTIWKDIRAQTPDFTNDLSLTEALDIAFIPLATENMGARQMAKHFRNKFPQCKLFLVTSWRGELDNDILATAGISGVVHNPLRFDELKKVLFDNLG